MNRSRHGYNRRRSLESTKAYVLLGIGYVVLLALAAYGLVLVIA